MLKSIHMKKHLNIFLLSLLGGSMFGQQVSSTVVQNWLKQAQTSVKLNTTALQTNNKSSSFQSKANLTYCMPAEISSPEEITNVTIKTKLNTYLNNTSANNTAKGYEDFTTVKATNLGRTTEYTFTFQGDTKGAYYSSFMVMIDYNQDGIFGSAGPGDNDNDRELIKIKDLLYNSNGVDGKTVSGKVIIPQDAALGNTRLRVIKRQTDKKSFLYAKDACDIGTVYGQVEDYIVNITAPIVCTTTPNGAAATETYIPTNNQQDVMLKNASLGTYVDVFVYEGNNYTFEASNKNTFLSIKDVSKNENLAAREAYLDWTSDRTGIVRLYLHSDENCSVSAEKTDVSIFSFSTAKNPINEPCNLGIPTVDFQLTKEFNGANSQEIALDLNAYSGRETKISGIKLNLQGDATKVDFVLIDDANGLPSVTSTKVTGKILSKKLIGTINGKPSYTYDIDFDKVIDLNSLESDTTLKKWLKIVTDAQTLEVNTNFVVASRLAIKNAKNNQGKWTLDKNSEAVYQLKAECQYNACKQVVPETPKIEGFSLPTMEAVSGVETIIDVVSEKGKKLEISGFEIDAWSLGFTLGAGAPEDLMPILDLKLLENNPATGNPYNKKDKKGITPISIASLDTINLQTILLPSDEISILLVKKRLKVKLEKPILIDGDKEVKYWLSLNAENLFVWDTNPNVDVTIGNFPKWFSSEAIPPLIPNDKWEDVPSEIVYKLISTCNSSLGTGEVNTIDKLKVYPNPFKDQVTIESLENLKQIEIYNMAGLRVSTKEANDRVVNLSLGQLPSGVYLLKTVDVKGKVNTQKLIKK